MQLQPRSLSAGRRAGVTRGAGAVVRGAARLLAVIAAVLAGVGWLYVLRGLRWFALGGRVGDALPLLQLAGGDGQPVVRVAVAWLAAGLVAGVVLGGLTRLWRIGVCGGVALILLLAASQASYALARNLRFSAVLWARSPGAGPWVEALLFAAGCGLLARSHARRDEREPLLRGRSSGASGVDFVRHVGVGGGERGDAG